MQFMTHDFKNALCSLEETWLLTYNRVNDKTKTKLNSVAWVRERTIPTERPTLVCEVSANFRG
jgi:hypothetical protein